MTDEEIISRSTAEALLGAYGADPKRWPAEWREALDRAIAYHAGLKELVEQQAALDRDLNAYSVTPSITVDDVVARVGSVQAPNAGSSSGWLEGFLDWLLPPDQLVLWRGATAALIPLFIGLWLGSTDVAEQEQWWGAEQVLFSADYGFDAYELDIDSLDIEGEGND